jgi:hypothetical protein
MFDIVIHTSEIDNSDKTTRTKTYFQYIFKNVIHTIYSPVDTDLVSKYLLVALPNTTTPPYATISSGVIP